jgi:hypothetical protein
MTIDLFPFGRWNGDLHDYVAVTGKLATEAWIEKSSFEKIPHSGALMVDVSLVVDGVYCSRADK